jgi:ring-1,2-phenylacetyl-CoA epoxidase subunit PaaC
VYSKAAALQCGGVDLTMTIIPEQLKTPLVNLLLSLADDKLILGHRNSDWTGLGPILEEDIAFSHMAQDEMAHAQAIYELSGELLSRSADELAFGRRPDEFRCAQIVEVPDEFDWATAMARKFFCDHFDALRLQRMAKSSWKPVADLAIRMAAEEQLHVEHVDSWMARLGRGTTESRDRLQRALDALAPLAPMLFELVEGQGALADVGLYSGGGPADFQAWREQLRQVTDKSNLCLPDFQPPTDNARGGRHGVHTPHLGELLNEMCEVWRVEPGAKW